ncbi:unnamed protein product, partial [Sphenostylis stenocarpa]
MDGEKGKGTEQTEPSHKPKNGSVFPKERRSVKSMMGEKMKQVVVDLVESTANKASKKVAPASEATLKRKAKDSVCTWRQNRPRGKSAKQLDGTFCSVIVMTDYTDACCYPTIAFHTA